MKKTQLDKVNFNKIRYANCWEDADLLLKGLDAQTGKKHLSIGSAGDNSFSLLATAPELVIAVDISPVQVHLIELKKAAIRQLDRKAYLDFAGFTKSEKPASRWNIYCELRKELPKDARAYWDAQKTLICNGIIYSGKFEHYLQLFSKYILPLIHSKSNIEQLLQTKAADKQEIFYQQNWNSLRWRMLFRLFFSRKLLGWLGRDPAFLKQVNIPVADFIFKKSEAHLISTEAQQNHILEFALRAKFQNNLPHYVKAGNYEQIQKHIDRLTTVIGPVERASELFGTFDYFNLSNIFEYLDKKTFETIARQLVQAASAGAKMMYWNLMVDRKMSGSCSNLRTISNIENAQADKGFFYKNYWVEQKVA